MAFLMTINLEMKENEFAAEVVFKDTVYISLVSYTCQTLRSALQRKLQWPEC